MHSAAIINQTQVTVHCSHLLPSVILALKVSKNRYLISTDLSSKSMFRKSPGTHCDSWHFPDMKDFVTGSYTHCSTLEAVSLFARKIVWPSTDITTSLLLHCITGYPLAVVASVDSVTCVVKEGCAGL